MQRLIPGYLNLLTGRPAIWPPLIIEAMKYLIRLQREGWYFAGFVGPSAKAEIGRIHQAKIYYSESDALGNLSRMGHYGQQVISMSELKLNKCGNRMNFKSHGCTPLEEMI